VVVTEELAFRLERAANRWGAAWMAGIAGIELGDFGAHVLAPCHRERPELDFQNRVNGLTPDDAALVPDIVAWYAERGIRPWFELVPTDRSGDLLAALAAAGATAIGFHGFVTTPLPALPARPFRSTSSDPMKNSEKDAQVGGEVGVQVVDPTDDEAFATFARTRTAAHELPPEVVEQATADLGGWRTAPDATLYLACVDGEPAATAVLTTADGVAYLADGATLPRFRGHGLQTHLIRRRLADAAAAGTSGADVAGSQAAVGSTSHRNLQREGLTSGFTKLVLRVAGGEGRLPTTHR
jgi:GNAT superfamily N-acetyltransferase